MAVQENAPFGIDRTIRLAPSGSSGPNFVRAGENICVAPGDRIIVVGVSFLSTPPPGLFNEIRPDGTAGAGAGYVLHIAYKPWYYRLQDIDQIPEGAREWYGVGGNAVDSSIIRVDLQYLYCRWGGNVCFTGGVGPPGYQPEVVVAYYWDRSQRNKPFITPTNQSGFVRHTLTFTNAFGPDGSPLRIQRPVCAANVWTPQARGIQLDYGAGTYAMNTRTDSETRAVQLGSFTEITLTDKSEGEVIFGIYI